MKRVLMVSAILLLVGGGAMGAKAQDPASAPADSDLLGPDLDQMGAPGDWGPGFGMLAAGDQGFRGGPGRGMHGPGMRGRGPRGFGMRGHGVRGPGLDRGGSGLQGRLARLDLTQDQKDRIASIHETHARAMIQSRADFQLARLDLGKLLSADSPDERAIDAQIDKIASIRADMAKSRVGARLEVRSILTPEQRAKLHAAPPRAARDDGDRSPRRDRRRR